MRGCVGTSGTATAAGAWRAAGGRLGKLGVVGRAKAAGAAGSVDGGGGNGIGATAALAAGKPVPVTVTPTLADGLAVPVVGPHAFEVARHYVDETVLCTEKEISLAVLRLIENEKMVVEGGGASGLAALLPGGALDRPELKGKNIVVPLCGGNIDTTTLGRVIDRGLAADDRLCNFTATVSDRPGGIAYKGVKGC